MSDRALRDRHTELSPGVYATRRRLLWLAAVYVLGCGFRSAFPMVDVPRICLHDTWLSRIAVGRTVATVAELAFAAQWAILLREAGAATGSAVATAISRILIPTIAVAQVSCWLAVLSTDNLAHAVENSLWTLAAGLVIAGFASAHPFVDQKSRRFLDIVIVCGAGYILFMITYDVPMYLARWQAELASAHRSLPLLEGARAIVQRCTVVREWAVWRQDAVWLSLYFTVAVWISLALPHAPLLRRSH